MLDLLCESGCNEALLNKGTGFDSALLVCLQKLQLLGDVGTFLVILAVSVHIGKESPVVKVIDGILEDGVCCSVAPEMMAEPGRQWLHWLVRGIVGGSIQLDNSCLLLSLGSAVEPSNPSIIELLDEAGKSFCSVIKGDSEVREMLPILLVPRWALAEAVVVIVHPLLKCCNIGFEPLDLLPMDIVSDPDGGSKSSDNGPELVRGQIGHGSKDILHRGGGEGESPGVSGGESNSHTFLGDLTHLEGVILAEAEMPWEAVSGLFRG